MATFAKVAFESPLPQLDRLFDYSVPETLRTEIAVGQRVRAPFGKAGKLVTGFVVELTDSIEYQGAVNDLELVLSPHIVLPENLYRLIRSVADRQAVSFGDVAKAAIPNFMVRSAKVSAEVSVSVAHKSAEPVLTAAVCPPVMRTAQFGDIQLFESSWIIDALDCALDQISTGYSTIICVPDYRDVQRVAKVFSQLQLESLVTVVASDQPNSTRYRNHIAVLSSGPHVVIGTRSALFTPLQNLGAIVVWDDEDSSHQDQSSPYVSSREVALLRQTIDNCSLNFLSHSRSLAIQRLVEMSYLTDITEDFRKPAIAFSEHDVRVDTLAFKTVRAGLKRGPVLVQVSNIGVAKSAYCASCSDRATCNHCNGPLWIDNMGKTRCRWCNGFNLGFRCAKCSGEKLRMGRAGSTRTAAELGGAFPGVQIVEATGENVVLDVDASPKIVIATPGAEPVAVGGYFAVVILDCDVALAKDSLKAREDAVRSWTNALALANLDSHSALIGLPTELGVYLATWRLVELASLELADREALGFPPAKRMISASGLKELVQGFAEELAGVQGVKVLGSAPLENSTEWRVIASFSYASGKFVADLAKKFQLKNAGAKRVNVKSGQNQRAVSIKIDDPRVI